ncbi:MAG: ANTAR domain-containing protein [Lachnospiraceae bacterium]|nr:ANTAR domain-containing protein [Lachnospiraceae bacterium]
MFYDRDIVSVLLISASQKMTDTILELLPHRQFQPVTTVSTAGEARRLLVEQSFDLVLIISPLRDDFGVQLAVEVADNGQSGVLLFVKADLFEQASYKVESHGVLTLAVPCQRTAILQSVKLLVATRARLKVLENRAISLEAKMEEIRIVNRAKLLLIERLKMSEAEAHRYIEKNAMDTCQKRSAVAQGIIRTYET